MLLFRIFYQINPFDFTTRLIIRGEKPGDKIIIPEEESGIFLATKRFFKLILFKKK